MTKKMYKHSENLDIEENYRLGSQEKLGLYFVSNLNL